jgi:hypothetical protein
MQFLKITIAITRDVLITKIGPMTNTFVTTGDSPITAIVSNIEDVAITTVIVATENVHMINTVITSTMNIKDTSTPIMVIGGPGINGTGTQDSTLIFTSTEDIIAKVDI